MSLSRQVPLILVCLIAVAAISCTSAGSGQTPLAQPAASTQSTPPPSPPHAAKTLAVSCPAASNAPIVVVSVVGDKAVPDPDCAHVNARHKQSGKKVPGVINWFGPDGQELQVAMQDSNQQCIRVPIMCNGSHCHAVTNPDVADQTSCKYRVWVVGVTLPYDPVVVVDNCCDNLENPNP